MGMGFLHEMDIVAKAKRRAKEMRPCRGSVIGLD
jgi:hypothetical protein